MDRGGKWLGGITNGARNKFKNCYVFNDHEDGISQKLLSMPSGWFSKTNENVRAVLQKALCTFMGPDNLT